MWRYLGITSGLVCVPVILALSLYLAWPWVMSESMRLAPLEMALTWLAELGALIWFVYFLIKFMVTSETDSAFDEDIAHAPGKQLLALLVVLAAGVDLGATFYFQAQDNIRRSRAATGVCEITKTKVYSQKPVLDDRQRKVGEVFWVLAWCDVKDELGIRHATCYYGKSNRFPESVHEAIMFDRLPAEMEATFDETFPRKFWVAGIEDEYLGIWRLSQEITLFAIVLSLLVLATNKILIHTPVPLEICPLIGVTLRVAIAALYMISHGQTSIPPM